MPTRRTVLLTLAALPAACTALPGGGPSSRLIILRHADRDTLDPELNAAGRARSAALPAALTDQQIDAIFCPDILRNLDTAAPLAAARGLSVQTIDATVFDSGSPLVPEILRRQPTGTSVWIGNTGNLRGLWEEIGAPGSAPTNYGEIAIVEMRGPLAGRIEKRRFGL